MDSQNHQYSEGCKMNDAAVQDGTLSEHPQASLSSGSLNIIIVGAGIGGLSAALFLRQRGHTITILEQSQLAQEVGAAVHLAPNANGLLRKLGIWAEDIGANPALRMTQYFPDGNSLFSVNLEERAPMWQHPWLLAHRAHLHSELKRRATMAEGTGRAAVLRTGCRVSDVDCKGNVTLDCGEKIHGDVIVGADGVHSKTRTKLPGADLIKPHGSGKSAYRFLISRQKTLDDSETAKYAKSEGHLQMFIGQDRRVVIYPTSNNTLLNFVCIHPTKDSQAVEDASREWNHQGDLNRMLQVYKDFEPSLVKLLGMAEEGGLKVWELLDMETLPRWTKGSLCCIGDAAHPFTPHQGQGAGQAIEDAASLAVMLPLGTPIEEIPERLKLYEECRYERASKIQEYSRIAGRDLGEGPQFDANQYTAYNFGHDEWDFSSQKFREYTYSKTPHIYWRNPISFGPMPGPRQDIFGNPHDGSLSTFRTATIKFKTSRTLLQNLLPHQAFRFTSPSSVAHASLSFTTLSNLNWLGGRGYNHLGLYIHGVEYTNTDGEVVKGGCVPILFENLPDPILSGREELGMPKMWCDLDLHESGEEAIWQMFAGWMGAKFCEMTISDLEDVTAESTSQLVQNDVDEALLWYKYIARSGTIEREEQRQADANYAVYLQHDKKTKTTERKVDMVKKGKGSFTFDALNERKLPTLHHIIERLVEIPVYENIEATVVKGRGVSDVSTARRLS